MHNELIPSRLERSLPGDTYNDWQVKARLEETARLSMRTNVPHSLSVIHTHYSKQRTHSKLLAQQRALHFSAIVSEVRTCVFSCFRCISSSPDGCLRAEIHTDVSRRIAMLSGKLNHHVFFLASIHISTLLESRIPVKLKSPAGYKFMKWT